VTTGAPRIAVDADAGEAEAPLRRKSRFAAAVWGRDRLKRGLPLAEREEMTR